MMENNQHNHSSRLPGEKSTPGTGEKILRYTAGLKVPGKLPKEEAFARLAERMETGPGSTGNVSRLRSRTLPYWGAAAGIVLILGILFIFVRDTDIKVTAGNGQHVGHRLPDGSMITLNAASKISYDKKDFLQNRTLQLEGEALCNVVKGTDFVIYTRQGDVEIIGTRLNVYARSDGFKVSCLTGKVRVSVPSGSGMITGGESIKLYRGKLVKEVETDAGRAVTWQQGLFYFKHTALNSVLDEIERQFDVSIETSGTGDRYFTGSFRSDNLEDALDIICIPMAFTYTKSKNKIFIKEEEHHTP